MYQSPALRCIFYAVPVLFYLLYLNSRFCHLQNTLKMPTKSESKRLVHSWECFGLPISWRIPFQMNDKELTILLAIRFFSANKLNRHAQAHWDKNNDIHPFDKHNGTKQKTLFFLKWNEMKWKHCIPYDCVGLAVPSSLSIFHYPISLRFFFLLVRFGTLRFVFIKINMWLVKLQPVSLL